MNRGPIEDRLAIRELIEAFAAGAMRFDPDYWGQTWADDGVWKLVSMPEPVHGKENIVAAFVRVMSYAEALSMISFPADLVVEGDRAQGKAYCRELIFPKAGGRIAVVGCYHDQYVRRDGRWLFQSRFYEILRKEQVA